MVLQIFTDGASRGNPGEAGAGAVIFQNGEEIKRVVKYLGKKTNNEAEYTAVIEAIKVVKELKLEKENVLLFSDSEFLTKQLKGDYAVKAAKIKPLFEKVDKLRKGIQLKVNWIPREDNKLADELANQAIDEVKGKSKRTSVLGQEFKEQTASNFKEVPSLILDRAFFGKINCLKIQLSSNLDCYFHLGLDKKGQWDWQKVKMSSSELGEIIHLLRLENGKCSFFHSFNDSKTQIWCNKSEKGFSIKIADVSKNLILGESEVLRIILEEIIRRKEFN